MYYQALPHAPSLFPGNSATPVGSLAALHHVVIDQASLLGPVLSLECDQPGYCGPSGLTMLSKIAETITTALLATRTSPCFACFDEIASLRDSEMDPPACATLRLTEALLDVPDTAHRTSVAGRELMEDAAFTALQHAVGWWDFFMKEAQLADARTLAHALLLVTTLATQHRVFVRLLDIAKTEEAN